MANVFENTTSQQDVGTISRPTPVQEIPQLVNTNAAVPLVSAGMAQSLGNSLSHLGDAVGAAFKNRAEEQKKAEISTQLNALTGGYQSALQRGKAATLQFGLDVQTRVKNLRNSGEDDKADALAGASKELLGEGVGSYIGSTMRNDIAEQDTRKKAFDGMQDQIAGKLGFSANWRDDPRAADTVRTFQENASTLAQNKQALDLQAQAVKKGEVQDKKGMHKLVVGYNAYIGGQTTLLIDTIEMAATQYAEAKAANDPKGMDAAVARLRAAKVNMSAHSAQDAATYRGAISTTTLASTSKSMMAMLDNGIQMITDGKTDGLKVLLEATNSGIDYTFARDYGHTAKVLSLAANAAKIAVLDPSSPATIKLGETVGPLARKLATALGGTSPATIDASVKRATEGRPDPTSPTDTLITAHTLSSYSKMGDKEKEFTMKSAVHLLASEPLVGTTIFQESVYHQIASDPMKLKDFKKYVKTNITYGSDIAKKLQRVHLGKLLELDQQISELGGEVKYDPTTKQFKVLLDVPDASVTDLLKNKAYAYLVGKKGAASLTQENANARASLKINILVNDYIKMNEVYGVDPNLLLSVFGKTDQSSTNDFGKRLDGTSKGKGYFGVLKRPDGKVSTELSFNFTADGKDVFAPLLVPTLTKEEVDSLLSGSRPSKETSQKAMDYAMQRIKDGKPTFATKKEEGSYQLK